MSILIADALTDLFTWFYLTSSNTGARILTMRLSKSWHTVYNFFHINLAKIFCYSISYAKRADVASAHC